MRIHITLTIPLVSISSLLCASRFDSFLRTPLRLPAAALSPKLHTTALLQSHVRVENCWRNSRLLLEFLVQRSSLLSDFVSRGSRIRKTIELENDELLIPIVYLSDEVASKIAGTLKLAELQSSIDQRLQPRSGMIPESIITLHERIVSRKVATTSNVVGLLEGSDAQLKSETIIISAHHDHDGKIGKQIFRGADDNASGTAGVVALAQALSTNSSSTIGLKPKRSILFSVFAAEEQGLLGSYYMVAHPLRPLATTRAMINFDMIGRNESRCTQTDELVKTPVHTNNRLNITGAHYSPDYDKIVRAQNEYVGLTLDDRFDSENALNILFRSDQFPFILNKVPAFWWFTGFHPDYHQTTDTANLINYPKMQKILRLAYLSAYQLANSSIPPLFIENPRPK